MACWDAAKRDFIRAHKHADTPHPLRLLRMRRKRPCCAPPSSDMSSPNCRPAGLRQLQPAADITLECAPDGGQLALFPFNIFLRR